MTRTTDRIATLTTLVLMLSGLLVACGGPDTSIDQNDGLALAGKPSNPSKPTNPGKPTDPGKPSDPGVPSVPGAPAVPTAPADPTAPAEPTATTEPGTATEPAAPAPVEPNVALAFAAALPAGAYTPLTEATLSFTRAVWVVADWTGVTADQSERLTLWSPSGSVYYATNISFADAATTLVSSSELADGTRRVVYKVLIRGTTIESYGQVGTWTADVALLDGSTTATTTLVLN